MWREVRRARGGPKARLWQVHQRPSLAVPNRLQLIGQVLARSNRGRTSAAKITNSAPKVAATIQTVCAEAGSRLPVISGSLARISPEIPPRSADAPPHT